MWPHVQVHASPHKLVTC